MANENLPLPTTKGPYSLDLDALFAEASESVLARGDIRAQLNALDEPPDLEHVFVIEREVLFARVQDLVARCTARGDTLHAMLAAQLTNQIEFRTLVTEWESQRREIVQSLEQAMLSVALTALNTSFDREAAPHMRVTSFDGLRESVTSERIVITDAYVQLEEMLRDRNEGSLGIAGPRGVGKSTLINFFAATKGVRIRDTVKEGGFFTGDELEDLISLTRPRLGVVVSAPVAYEPKEFVLHLHAEMCRRVLGGSEYPERSDVGLTSDDGARLRRLASWLKVLGSCTLTGGLALLTLAIIHRLPWTWRAVADAGAVLLVTVALGFVVRSLSGNGIGLRIDSKVRFIFAYNPGWGAGIVAAVAVLGLMLLIEGGGWSGGVWPFLFGLLLVIVSVELLPLANVAHSLGKLAPSDSLIAGPGTRLRELALEHLRQIRYQQSFSHERSVAVKVGGKLPVGLDVGGKRGTTMDERPKGYPELVSDLRDFLTIVAEDNTVIVGVDELDKMRSADDVEKFLNDIKGIFGTPGCHFLVSVSEDAAASFERRGIPFRDVFDSAFDDVISVRHLDLAAARKVLYGFLLGWTKPFVGLCYVLSGGLGRDLRRIARELVTHRDDKSEIALGPAALAMCRREGTARLRAIRHELMRDPFDQAHIDLLTRIADLTPNTATAANLRAWHDDLASWAERGDATAGRLGLELAAYFLFAATVIEFFDPALVAARVAEAESPDAGAKALDTLAAARQCLAVSPGMSLAYTQRFREAWGLAPR